MNLDPRQRAMLEEMGIALIGWPRAAAPGTVPAVTSATVVAEAMPQLAAAGLGEPSAAPATTPPRAPVAPQVGGPERSAARMPPPSMSSPAAAGAAAASPGATVLAESPLLLHGAAPEAKGGWLIVADMPPGLDGRHGEPYAEEAGQLLANMLRALQLPDAGLPVHLMRTHRGVASGQPGGPAAIDQLLPSALDALAPRVVLAMGPLAAQSLLRSNEPLGRLRGRRHSLPAGVADPAAAPALVATYHPAYLLRNPADKARAWADLCLAADCL